MGTDLIIRMYLTYLLPYLHNSKHLMKGLLLFVQRMWRPFLFALPFLTACMEPEFQHILTAPSPQYLLSKCSWHIHSQSHSAQDTQGCSHPQLSVTISWPDLEVLNTYFAHSPLFYVCEVWDTEWTGFSGWSFRHRVWWITPFTVLCLLYQPRAWLHTLIPKLYSWSQQNNLDSSFNYLLISELSINSMVFMNRWNCRCRVRVWS